MAQDHRTKAPKAEIQDSKKGLTQRTGYQAHHRKKNQTVKNQNGMDAPKNNAG